MPTSLAANCTFRTSTYTTLLHSVSQLKHSPKRLFYSLTPDQNILFICYFLYNVISGHVTSLLRFIMVLTSDTEKASYF